MDIIKVAVLAVIALLIIGPDKLPDLARSAGRTYRAFLEQVGSYFGVNINENSSQLQEARLAVEDGDLTRQVEELTAVITVMQLLKQRITVFVSSAMDEFRDERRATAQTIESLLAFRPWLFEDHGGPERKYVVEVCLSAVRECDVFLMLVGLDISEIVLQEYSTAFNAKKPMLVYVKKCDRSNHATQLLEKMGRDGITWTEFEADKQLEYKVKAGLLNHIVASYIEYGLSKGQAAAIGILANEFDQLFAMHKTLWEQKKGIDNRSDSVQYQTRPQGNQQVLLDRENRTLSRLTLSIADLAHHYSREGEKSHSQGQYPDAIHNYTIAQMLDPLNANHYIERARALNMMGHFVSARADANKAIQLDPNNSEGYMRLTYAYCRLRDYQHAISSASKAIELNPEGGMGYSRRAEAYNGLKEYQYALTDANKSIELAPREPLAYAARADVHKCLKEYSSALFDATKAIELGPNDSRLYAIRAGIENSIGDYQGALADSDKAIELKPNSAEGYDMRSYTHFIMENYSGALSDANRAVKADPNNADGYVRRSDAYRALQDYPRAYLDARKAVRLNPGNPACYEVRAKVLLSLGNLQQAEKDFNRAKSM